MLPALHLQIPSLDDNEYPPAARQRVENHLPCLLIQRVLIERFESLIKRIAPAWIQSLRFVWIIGGQCSHISGRISFGRAQIIVPLELQIVEQSLIAGRANDDRAIRRDRAQFIHVGFQRDFR